MLALLEDLVHDGEDALELPRLARDAADVALREYPQPLAEAVADLDAARSAYQALDAATRLTRASVRWLAILALAAWQLPSGREPASPVAGELLSALRKRRLTDEEWVELGASPRGPVRDAPRGSPGCSDLVRLLEHESPGEGEASSVGGRPRAAGTIATIVRRHAERAVGTLPTERAAAGELSVVLGMTADLLRSLSFLSYYSLVVADADGIGELWTGVRRKHRVLRALPPEIKMAPGEPVVVGAGEILYLAPLAAARKPSQSAEPELFLLEGRGRHGVLLVALPGGFEQRSDEARTWLNRLSAISDERESIHVQLDVPYRGLSPLSTADADLFFDREREVEAFVNRLRTEPLLVVVGPSGAGKSSFVRAGVIPALGEGRLRVVFRPGGKPARHPSQRSSPT